MSGTITTLANVAALRAWPGGSAFPVLYLAGYYSAGDQGGGLFVYNSADTTSADNGGTILVDASGNRYYRDTQAAPVNVHWFGALGNGAANDTTACQAADTWARKTGAVTYFPGGVYMVSQLVLNTGSSWLGDGRNATTLMQIVGSNTDLVYAYNSNANWGNNSPTTMVDGAVLRGLTLNGNWNAGAGNTVGNGISYFGARPIFEDIFITNCASHGMRTEYSLAASGYDTFTMEGYFCNVKVDTVGQHGWWNNGPNDSVAFGVIVVDAGQSVTNSFDGFYFDAKSTGRNVSFHAWNRSTSKRHRFALNLRPGSSHEFTGGCNFEGSYTAVVCLTASNCSFDSSTRFYSPWNGTNIYIGSTATFNIIKGWMSGPIPGQPAAVAVQFGGNSGDWIEGNEFDLVIAGHENGNFGFASGDAGNNRIMATCYNATAATINGTHNATDLVSIKVQNSSGNHLIT